LQSVKIKTLNSEIFEYKAGKIRIIEEVKSSSHKVVPKTVSNGDKDLFRCTKLSYT